VKFFKEALNGKGYVYSADYDPTAPGLFLADKSFLVPKVTAKDYIPFLIDKCKKENIKLIIPLIDPELPIIAKARNIFLENGITPLISNYETVMIGYDKLLTAKFFNENHIQSPNTSLFKEDTSLSIGKFPIIMKPRFGSASIGVQKCTSIDDVKFYATKISEPILQTFLMGNEITVDVLTDFEGRPLSIVQRKRLKVRAGEVERGITIKNEELFKLVLKIVEKLKPFGAINIQCFLTPKGFFFTEINTRFGGGYPLSQYAGVNFPKKIILLLEDIKTQTSIYDYEEGLLMLRYDEAIYIKNDQLLSKELL